MIVAEDLTRLFRTGDTEVRALDRVDLRIERGEHVAITGPSGSGKSTLMGILGCLDRPSSGRYLLDGEEVQRLGDNRLATLRNRRIGFVFQAFHLLPRLSAIENVELPLVYAGREGTRARAQAALEEVGLLHRARHRPVELSGGERQRVAIARALVNDPAIVFADEPTGNLDSRTGIQILDLFDTLIERGVTLIVVTHETEVARRARRTVRMLDGRIESDTRTGSEPCA